MALEEIRNIFGLERIHPDKGSSSEEEEAKPWEPESDEIDNIPEILNSLIAYGPLDKLSADNLKKYIKDVIEKYKAVHVIEEDKEFNS